MLTETMLQAAKLLVKGKKARVPAMNAEQWENFRWWLDYLQGYEMF